MVLFWGPNHVVFCSKNSGSGGGALLSNILFQGLMEQCSACWLESSPELYLEGSGLSKAAFLFWRLLVRSVVLFSWGGTLGAFRNPPHCQSSTESGEMLYVMFSKF